MRARFIVIPAVLVVVLLGARRRRLRVRLQQEIELAEGVKVGGVDVGGMEADAARAKLRSEVYDPLNQPVAGPLRRTGTSR